MSRMNRYERSPYAMTIARVPLLIFGIVLLCSIETVTTVTVLKAHEVQDIRLKVTESRHCDFPNLAKTYNTTDLLLCMNELASTAFASMGNARSSDDEDLLLGRSRRAQYPYSQYQQLQYNYPPRPRGDYQGYYETRPSPYYPSSSGFQGDISGYHDGGNKYPNSGGTPFSLPGGSGLFDALTSISQYDDLKCVPRLLCEVATGVIPGKSGYKQSYGDLGGNSLIRLLTALDIGGSSPLLTFGKSALTGYTSRGNPSVCYREYPRCPRNNADLVNYLNNHNGGFFRFFSNNRGQASQGSNGNYYRGALRRKPAPPPGVSGPEADRTGTGELKFDNSASLVGRDIAKSFFPEKDELSESNKVVFPQESSSQDGQILNRVSKSLSGYQDTGSGGRYPFFFPQDRKDQIANMAYGLNLRAQTPSRSSLKMESPKSTLYLLDDPSNDTTSYFTFPDGQKVRINVGFSKLFSDGYKKALRRSFANDHSPQPVDFEGFSMVNLAELFPNYRNRLDLDVVHPCDMICHDSKGTPVQFSQILLHSKSLGTLMTPDQPILDLSSPLPCEIMCIDRRGERRRLSTSLNQVLSPGFDRSAQPNFVDLQDNPKSTDYRWSIREQRRRNFRTAQSETQLQAPMPPDMGKSETNANRPDIYEKAASMPVGSRILRGPMPFFGPSMPFMGVPMSQGGPVFLPQRLAGQLGLGIIPPMQSFGTMPMFPGVMPMISPIRAGMASMVPVTQAPTKFCSDPTCESPSQLSIRALMMCGGVLYFIPYEIFVTMPICALWLESNDPSSQQSKQPPPSTSPPTLPPPKQIPETTMTPTTPEFRQPEGEDYPQVSCLEGESWNLDVQECVPMKYDKDIETDYIHLTGSPWSKGTRGPLRNHRNKKKKKKKLVIITDKGNITYIKTA